MNPSQSPGERLHATAGGVPPVLGVYRRLTCGSTWVSGTWPKIGDCEWWDVGSCYWLGLGWKLRS